MTSFKTMRYCFSPAAVEPSGKPAQSLAALCEIAQHPPARLVRRQSSTGQPPVVFYIFRVPGRLDLCLTTTKPSGDIVTDIDVSSALYYVRIEAAAETKQAEMTIIRKDVVTAASNEVAIASDPPGHIDVFEQDYANIEPRYWAMNGMDKQSLRSQFGCTLVSATIKEGLASFTSPWAGTCTFFGSKVGGSSVKCVHTSNHFEGGGRASVQVSELRFNIVDEARKTARNSMPAIPTGKHGGAKMASMSAAAAVKRWSLNLAHSAKPSHRVAAPKAGPWDARHGSDGSSDRFNDNPYLLNLRGGRAQPNSADDATNLAFRPNGPRAMTSEAPLAQKAPQLPRRPIPGAATHERPGERPSGSTDTLADSEAPVSPHSKRKPLPARYTADPNAAPELPIRLGQSTTLPLRAIRDAREAGPRSDLENSLANSGMVRDSRHDWDAHAAEVFEYGLDDEYGDIGNHEMQTEHDHTAVVGLELAREKLGGGPDGQSAKLGKLIVGGDGEGARMLDLVVSANMVLFVRRLRAAGRFGPMA